MCTDYLDPIENIISNREERNIGLENLNLETTDNVHNAALKSRIVQSQSAQKKKASRVSRIVVNTEKTLPVQKSDFPKSPLVDFIDFSIKSPMNTTLKTQIKS